MAQHVPVAPDIVSLFWVQNIAVMLWHKPATRAVIEGLHDLAAPKRAKYPTGMSFVHVGPVRYARLDGETRDAFVKNMRELAGYMAVTALVADAQGFVASTLRSVATNLLVLARIKHEVYLQDRVAQLLEWLPAKHEQLTGVHIDPAELARVLEHVERLQQRQRES
jgi:hypothetical protein